jgi:hypothetical protein
MTPIESDTPGRWQQIEELFHAALAMADGARPGYLTGACQDASICREVERLLTAQARAEGFLRTEPGPESSTPDEAAMVGRRLRQERNQAQDQDSNARSHRQPPLRTLI